VAAEPQTTESVEALARAYFERVAARDPDGMMEFWRPGGVGRIHGIAELTAPESYSAWFRNLFAAFPDWRFEVEEVIADERRAAVKWRATATFDGSAQFEGFDPTGDRIELRGVDVLALDDGQIVALDAYSNSMELARQIGAMPPQGSRAETAMAGAFNLKTRIARALKRS
jgi:steroid delta-isomerase-like uncharacterized protein